MKQKIIHHSVADWDFGPGMVKELTTAYFVSDPSSLHLGDYPNGTPDGAVLSRHPYTQVIPQGRIITQARQRTPTNQYRLIFRNQSPLGSSTRENCYEIRVDITHWFLYRIIAGGVVQIGIQPASHLPNTWERIRVTFYTGEDGVGNPALVVTYDKEVDGDWVQQGTPIFDTEDQWKDSEINRLGLATYGCSVGYEQWYDDTEIYERG